MMAQPDAVLLLGPTASGKSHCAMALAQHRPIEVISVDSAQVFRGMDIGTAKPSAADRAAVPHHLIDLIDPSQPYSVAAFCAAAQALIPAIRARGRIPVLVGGTMLYAQGLLQGLSDLPPADLALRADIAASATEKGWPALHAELAQIDPVTAARLKPSDAQRIQRALEVYQLTGTPLSALYRQAPRAPACKLLTLTLEPSQRAVLHERIAVRFRKMVQDGLLDEVRALRARGDLHPDLPSMRCVGYRQAWAWLVNQPCASTIPSWIEQGIAATRQLAKRQYTWLRAMPDRHVIDPLTQNAEQIVLEHLRRAYG